METKNYEETELLKAFRKIDQKHKDTILTVIQVMAQNTRSSELEKSGFKLVNNK